MDEVILIRSEPYGIFSTNGKDSMKLFYVRKETWENGEEWETFFTMIHDIQAAINMRDFSFCRMKTSAKDIKIYENDIIEGKFKKKAYLV